MKIGNDVRIKDDYSFGKWAGCTGYIKDYDDGKLVVTFVQHDGLQLTTWFYEDDLELLGESNGQVD